jgi:hypothetical protein
MANLAEICRPGRTRGCLPQYQRSWTSPGRPADLRSLAEDLLREMAFVCKATRSVRESMTHGAGSLPQCRINPANERGLDF